MDRPKGLLQPPTEELQSLRLIVEQKDAGALAKLASLTPANEIESSWTDYLSGLALFDSREFEEGLSAFLSVWDRAEKSSLPDLKRLAGMCLKKIGWNFRRQKDFQKAYDTHLKEYHLYEQFGSADELHDACISLDVDSFELKDFANSEQWLRTGIKHAAQIGNTLRRNRSLGMGFNNLSGTLCELRRFDEALEANKLSEQRWIAYESEHGSGEYRIAWVHVGYGTVYQKWAEYLKSQNGSFQELMAQALESYRKALELAIQLDMPASDRKYIEDRLAEVEKL